MPVSLDITILLAMRANQEFIMVLLSTHENKNDFASRLAAFRATNHGARPYDIAQAMEVSELQVLLHSGESMATTIIDTTWPDLFDKIPSLGRCMALTRNDSTVSEVKGTYGKASFHGPMGLVHHDTIDLRLFSSNWAFSVAVEQQKGGDILRSIQIFDKHGKAVHKIYPQGISDAAWDEFVSGFKVRTIAMSDILPPLEAAKLSAVRDFDVEKLKDDWSKLQDTHDFHMLLGSHKIGRLPAFEVVGEEFARKVDINVLVDVLQAARKEEIKFMIFVGNGRMIQIRSGTIKETRTLGSWFNILDPDFNLHVNMSKLESAWIVNKPSRHGLVRSVEVFDAQGEVAVTLFGYRTEELAVDPKWSELLDRVVPQV
ncbi:MAG: hemin-degrading factor [Proteobacteria bacterium]|nr:MAG: hemin-degrading factor [Pseudomonadota bacterium]